jgi:hypothetical protein
VRVLFLLLLLANILFLAWSHWIYVPPALGEQPVASNTTGRLKPIRLQNEPRLASTSPATGVNGRAPGSAGAASCVSVGPFIEQAPADGVMETLQRLGFSSRLRASVDEVRVGSWVRVPNLPTPEDAASALATLQAAGLGDAYIVTDEEPGNTVSLGVFADPARAAEVSDLVVKAGFAPETSDRLRTMDVFWLDVDRRANGSLPTLESLGNAPAGALPLEFRACPEASATGSTARATPAG